MSRLSKVTALIPALVSVGFFYWVFRDVSLASLEETLRSTHWELVLPAPMLIGLGIFFKAWRWQILLKPLHGSLPLEIPFSAMSVGTLVDQILPGKIGELVRAHLVGQHAGISRASVFGTVVVERVFDILSVLTLSGIAILSLGLTNPLLHRSLWACLLLLAILISLLLLFWKSRPLRQRLTLRFLPGQLAVKINRLLEEVGRGLRTITHWHHSGKALLATILMWGTYVIAFMPLLYAVGIQPEPPLHTAFVLIFLTAIGVAIPTAPGGMGIYEFVAALSLGITLPSGTVDSPEMAAKVAVFGLLYHLTSLGPELLAGIYCLNREFPGMGFRRAISRLRSQPSPET
ncbi:MAG: flippase-like domain-containing protein [Magnetococcales bacterium]|nr:flippase-like domain-containing protein [Magnetococcales bacterium]MBF0155906.1 flippase-like domain-containing protein [Magnetococcales bacterium]